MTLGSATLPRGALARPVAAVGRFAMPWLPGGPPQIPHAGLWQLVNRVNGNRYDAYQAKTTRPIALVVLSRAA